MPRVSILIVNWNGRHLLQECLDSLLRQTFRDFETILVDNGSSDGSRELLSEHYGWVKRIDLQSNTGFATANNLGLPQASGEFIVTLNNDTRAEPEWLAELVRVAETDPAIGMVASRTCVWDQPDTIDTLGGRICRDGMSRGALRGQSFSALKLPTIVPILYPSPSAALYRRAMLEEIGFFDDDIFAYAEDTDLGLRARWAGWGAVAATAALVHHRYSATGGMFSPFKLYLCERNHYWVAVKNFPLHRLLQVPFWTLARYLLQAHVAWQGQGVGADFHGSADKFRVLTALLRANRDALLSLPRMLKKRRLVARTRKLPAASMTRLIDEYRLGFYELLDINREKSV
jgi:GT2 family glycosyltransferase